MLEPPQNLAEAILTSTHNLCFKAKIRKIGIPLHTPVLLHVYKVGYKAVYITRTSFPDVMPEKCTKPCCCQAIDTDRKTNSTDTDHTSVHVPKLKTFPYDESSVG